MPSFARELEQTLHNALGEASSRRHEYATLEHLLLALIEDVHAGRVMEACGAAHHWATATLCAMAFARGSGCYFWRKSAPIFAGAKRWFSL